MSKRDFLSIDDVDSGELVALLDGADRHKADRRGPRHPRRPHGRADLREALDPHPGLFEVAVHELGGYPLPLAGAELQFGRGETLEDTAAVLSRYVHADRTSNFAQESLDGLARGGTIPVVTALSDYSHPRQALADLQTIRERKGSLAGIRLAYLGDGNNVAHSLLFAGAKMGMHVAVATPVGYEPIPQVVRRATEIAAQTGGSRRACPRPVHRRQGRRRALHRRLGVHGQGAGARRAALIFKPYQLSTDTVMAAAPDVMVLHCSPTPGEEIAAEVMDGPNSAVFDQAENRLHTQKALLSWLLTGSADPS